MALLNGLANIILREDWWNREFVATRTEGLDEWRASVEGYTPERVSELTGVSTTDLYRAADYYARPPYNGSCLIWAVCTGSVRR